MPGGGTKLFIGHDLGTGGDKAVLMDSSGRILATALASYAPSRRSLDRVEQDPREWWDAVSVTTRTLLREAGARKEDVTAMAFAGQMLSLVPMEDARTPSRPAIVWMDARAHAEAKRLIRRCGGERILKLVAGALPSGKDIVAKILWIRENEPTVFTRTRAFSDATGYLVARATGELVMDRTGASGTGILVSGTGEWSKILAALALFPLDKMPRVLTSTESLPLTVEAALECGLAPGTPVMAGLSDIPSAAVGAGAVRDGDAHVYLGTSSWIAVTSKRALSDPAHGIASIASADQGLSLGIGECETAGACIDWFTSRFTVAKTGGAALAELDALIRSSDAGADGLLFAPWMHGERSPVSDATLRGAFLNLSLEHETKHFARAVAEGVALNLLWVLSAFERLVGNVGSLRALGGGATSDTWLQIIADVTQRRVERVAHPRFAGAKGAALTAAVGAGAFSTFAETRSVGVVEKVFMPTVEHAATYATLLSALKRAYPGLSSVGRSLSR